MTPDQYAYILIGWFCLMTVPFFLLAAWDKRIENRDTTPDVSLDDLLDRGLQDDTTEEQLFVWGDILRATPVALDLADPPASILIARSPLLDLDTEAREARIKALTTPTAAWMQFATVLYGERVEVPLVPVRSFEAATQEFEVVTSWP